MQVAASAEMPTGSNWRKCEMHILDVQITGKATLAGSITIPGSKNAALPIMIASLLFISCTVTMGILSHVHVFY